ncbi:hypothetical protein GOODEAATRI_014675, partial [Goodea atripinnis]
VVIFVKSVNRCVALSQLLVEQNFPAIAIHRGMTQEERLSRYQQFKDFQRRILVATNLFGRGMDIERVNIVFNYDMPEDSDTYLHRVSSDLKYSLDNSFVFQSKLQGRVCHLYVIWKHICMRLSDAEHLLSLYFFSIDIRWPVQAGLEPKAWPLPLFQMKPTPRP